MRTESRPARDATRTSSRLLGPSVWYGVLALAIGAPLLRGGYLLLLDLALVDRVSVRWWPTLADTGPVNAAPTFSMIWLLVKLGWIAGPLLVCGVFFGMGLSMHRAVVALMPTRHSAAQLFAGTLYMVNPFVYERLMAGHLLILIAYAVAPLALIAAVGFVRAPGARTGARWALATTVIAWSSIHYLVMLLVVVFPLVLLHRSMRSRRGVRAASVAAGVFLVLNAWWIVALMVSSAGSYITERDLDVYRTQPVGPSVVGNVAALYGFWRHEFVLPKDGVSAWWAIAMPVAGLIVVGIVVAVRDPARRAVGLALTFAIPVCILLASGTSFPPTQGVYGWLFRTVPGFALFREPQKWVALLPLSYAMLGAVGLDRILTSERRAESRTFRRATVGVLIGALLVYGNALVWNHSRLRPVRFPADWARADRVVSAEGGRMLFLPWHLYVGLSFTGRRVLNPAPYYFSVPVLSGDNVEVPGIRTQSTDPRSARIEAVLYQPEGQARFVETMRAMCVHWVALAHETDFEQYAWLGQLEGLTPVIAGSRLTLYRVNGLDACSAAK